ncbi:UDP-glycosyltransferase 78D2 [Vitis vinifera]|uniref:UDP-glycosyltransferase 78D2 n=1 Tax=Vitis vinifera TaxID=29760 RepID=A0A438I205_VITVI|nr:UDP-glycosyltransferase 78D2 [Vitis vinifera]
MLTNQKARFHLIRLRSEDWRARRGGLCITKFSRSSWAKSVHMHQGTTQENTYINSHGQTHWCLGLPLHFPPSNASGAGPQTSVCSTRRPSSHSSALANSNSFLFSAQSPGGVLGNLKSYDVADGVPVGHVLSGNPAEGVGLFLKEAPANFKRAMEVAVAETGRKISCLVTDAFLWFAADMAEEMGVPWVPFWIAGLSALCVHLHTDAIRQTMGVRESEVSGIYQLWKHVGTSPDEHVALAETLQATGVAFLWSIKDNSKKNLPEGFLERTSGNGKVVPWAPQIRVLAHPSVGVHITHGGWNSVMESIAGEPRTSFGAAREDDDRKNWCPQKLWTRATEPNGSSTQNFRTLSKIVTNE